MARPARVKITETTSKSITVEMPKSGNRWEVGHILALAAELDKAVTAGMPRNTPVFFDNNSVRASHVDQQTVTTPDDPDDPDDPDKTGVKA